MSRPNFVYPPSSECPRGIANDVYDVRMLRGDEAIYTRLRTHWGTLDFFMLAVQAVYEANGWNFSRKEKATFRKIFRGQLTE